MPDISMCQSGECPVQFQCHRNEASGTRPSEWRQAYMDWRWSDQDGDVKCDGYWPTRAALAGDHPHGE